MSAVEGTPVNGPGRSMTPGEVLQTGIEIMEAGYPVFPIALSKLTTKVEKVPLTNNGHLDATTDPEVFKEQIREAHLRLNGRELGLGVVPGAGGAATFDYDTKNGGKGNIVHQQHIAKYGEAFERCTYSSISGATNALLTKPNDRQIGNHSPWPDVDVRGDGGWVVPPGVFCTWGEWAWTSGDWNDLDEKAAIPGEVFAMLRSPGEESTPAKSAEVDAWLDANHLTALPSQITTKQLERYCATIGTAAGRNPALKDALDWVKHQYEGIDRREAFEAIEAAWQARMIADGEKGRLGQAKEVLARVVGYDMAWQKAAEAEKLAEKLQDTAPAGVEMEEGQTLLDALRARLYTVSELANIPAPDPLVEGFLFRDSLAWLIGESGVGKSFVALDIAMRIGSQGGEWHGYPVKSGRVLYVAAEGLSGIKARADAWMKHHGVTSDPDVVFLGMAVNVSIREWADVVAELVAEDKFDMVILDTLARSTVGAEENSASEAGVVVDNLDRIRVQSACCVLLVHHTGKNAALGGRGSTAFKGALESELTVTGSTEKGLKVESTKQKNVEEAPPLHFEAVKVGLGAIGFDGEEAGSIVLEPTVGEPSDDEDDSESVSAVGYKHRIAILRVLKRANEPISLYRIREELTKTNWKVSPATIRGCCEALKGSGMADELPGPRGSRLFSISVAGLENPEV